MKNKKQLKVFAVRIDNEEEGYSENMSSFTLLAETFEEAFEEAKKRMKTKSGDVIGIIELVNLID